MKTGIGLLQTTSLPETMRLTQRVEALGYDSIWYAEHNFSRDAVTACAAAAALTTRLIIGPCVVPIFTRSPLLMATTFAALDELSEGRIVAGIGAGSRVLIKAQGIDFRKPLVALREYVEACRAVWGASGGHVSYSGEIVRLEDAELDFEPVRRDLPVWLGPTGPLACELTGEIAEGAALNAFLSPDYARWAIEYLQAGAERADRSMDDIEVGMMVVAAVDDSKEAAREYLRPLLAVYLARLPDIAKRTSLWGEEGEGWRQLAAAVDKGGGEAGKPLVGDELIDEITINGTPDDCREGLQRYVDAGVNHPIITVFGDIERGIEELAPARRPVEVTP
ncbi:MAG: LLM class flavin-dependent oxidoreductase [Acidimicrobiia bacterium]